MTARRWLESGAKHCLVLCVLLGILLAVHASYFYPFFSDDALISLRYAERLSQGQGLTWTDGERVEGYTDLLWVLLLSIPARLGVDLIPAARALGFLGALVAVLCAGTTPERPFAWRPERLLSGSLFLVLAAPVAAWALAGLEHAFMLGVFGLGLLFLLRALPDAATADLVKASVFFAALALLRADGVVLVCCAAAGFVLGSRSVAGLRGAFVFAIVPALALGAQLVFRLSYYGAWVPNTALAKVSLTSHRLVQGLEHVMNGLMPLAPVLALAALVPFLVRGPARRRALLLWTAALGWWAYVALVGGDIFPGWRQVLLGLVPVAFLLAEGGAWVRDRASRDGLANPLVLWASAIAAMVWLGYRDGENRRAKNELWEWSGLPLGRALKQGFARHDPLLAVDAAGALPYWSGLRSLDMLGLNDAYIPRHPPPGFGRGVIGHELGDGDYVRQRAPDIIAFCGSVGSRRPCFVGGHQLVRQPTFRRDYAFIRVSAGPPAVVGELYIRREGTLGIRRTDDSVTIPGHFFGGGSALARLEGDEFVTPVTARRPGRFDDLELAPGVWVFDAGSAALDWGVLCDARSAAVVDLEAPVSVHISRRTRVGLLVGTREENEQLVGQVVLRKAASDAAPARYACPVPKRVERKLAELPRTAAPGSDWDGPRNVLFDRRGLRVMFDEPQSVQALELSTDNNDVYLVRYIAQSGESVGESRLLPEPRSPGLLVHAVQVPDSARGEPLAALEIVPVSGDGSFSLGHLAVTPAAPPAPEAN
jgi:hypothetical protein